MLKISSILVLTSLCLLLPACTKSDSSEPFATPAPSKSAVDKPMALKELVIGMDISKIKNAREVTSQTYIFDMEYYGSKRTFVAKVNKGGQATMFKTTVDGTLDQLQSALEEKLSADNAKPVAFDCKTNAFKPDSSADISIKTCKVVGPTETLKIEESRMEPTAKLSGLPQLATVVISVDLEGTQLAAEARAAEEKSKADIQRAEHAVKKKDL